MRRAGLPSSSSGEQRTGQGRRRWFGLGRRRKIGGEGSAASELERGLVAKLGGGRSAVPGSQRRGSATGGGGGARRVVAIWSLRCSSSTGLWSGSTRETRGGFCLGQFDRRRLGLSSPRRGYGGGAVERGEGYLGPIRSNGRVSEHQGGAEDLTEQWLDEEGRRRRRSTCRSEVLGGGDADRPGEGLGVVDGASNEFVAPRRSFVHGRFENGGVVHGKWPEQRARSVGDDGGGVLCFLGGNRKGRRKMDRGWVLETGRSECGVFASSKREGG